MPPAARVGDTTAHGGVISPPGFPLVMIEGFPAARVGDMHACPVVDPVTHTGGPILPPGSPTVMIGGMPAARMFDLAQCVGVTDTIMKGAATVLIGP